MRVSIFFLFFCLTIHFACQSKRLITGKDEAIVSISKVWPFRVEHPDSSLWVISEKAWLHDSLGITEVKMIRSDQDTSGVVHFSTPLLGYRFYDLRKHWAYEYGSMADTACLVKKYQYTDTTKFFGGFPFQRNFPFKIHSITAKSDTLIKGVGLKQFEAIFSVAGMTIHSILRFQVNKPISIFQYDNHLSDSIGYPLVAVDVIPNTIHDRKFALQIQFINLPLPDSVKKAFDHWKKLESSNPVVKK